MLTLTVALITVFSFNPNTAFGQCEMPQIEWVTQSDENPISPWAFYGVDNFLEFYDAGYSFEWSNGGNFIHTEYYGPGWEWIKITGNGCTYIDSFYVNLPEPLADPLPAPVAKFDVEGNNQGPDEEVYFINQSVNTDSLLWKFGDGTTSTDLSPTHVYSEPGFYTVQLQVWNSYLWYNIVTEEYYMVYQTDSKLLTVNVSVTTSASSAGEVEEKLVVYPNPASSMIQIQGMKIGEPVRVFSSTGQLVLNQLYQSELPVGDLPPGVYMISASDGRISRFVKI